MSNTDRSYTTTYNILRGQLIYNFHLENPAKQIEGPITPASVVTVMNNYQPTASCCSTSIPVIIIPVVIDNTLTILVYDTEQGPSVEWDGNTFTRNTDLPNFSYTATITSIPGTQVPSSANLIGVTIGNTVTSINNGGAFANCSNLATVIFTPTSTLQSIGDDTFFNSSLTSITIPDSVTSINASSFQKCTSLNNITIPNSVTSIGTTAFYDCVGLISITLPTNVLFTIINTGLFENCTSLTSITIPNSVTSIGTNAFNNCTNLTSITIPNSVTSIDLDAFSSSGLVTVTIANGQLGKTSPASGVAFFGATVNTILP